jgi:hypothetical protein
MSAGNISWDAVVVCKVGHPDVRTTRRPQPAKGRLAPGRIKAADLEFTESDETNLNFAAAIVHAARSSRASKRRRRSG